MKVYNLMFAMNNGAKRKLRVPYAESSLTSEAVQKVMEGIIALHIFDFDGSELATATKASIVSTQVEDVFDVTQ